MTATGVAGFATARLWMNLRSCRFEEDSPSCLRCPRDHGQVEYGPAASRIWRIDRRFHQERPSERRTARNNYRVPRDGRRPESRGPEVRDRPARTRRRAAAGRPPARSRALPVREPGRGRDASRGTGSGPCRVRETDDARRGGCRKAGGPDVERHVAAAACDGKGIRVNGQYRTTVRGPATLTGTGSPTGTHHHRSRPLSRPRGAALPSRSGPCGKHCGARSPRFDSANC